MLKLKIFRYCFWACCLLLLGACAKKVTIAEAKANGFQPKNTNPFGANYEITGYMVMDPEPYLVSSTFWLGINRPVADTAYIRLIVPSGSKINTEPQSYEGRLVKVRGDLLDTPSPGDSLHELSMVANSATAVADAPCCNAGGPFIVPICSLNASICTENHNTFPQKFAILYSGGRKSLDAAKRYWNDLVFMYHVLHSKYGFKRENIIVVYKNGAIEAGSTSICQMPVHYAANPTGVAAAFAGLNTKISSLSSLNGALLFVFTTNHGGQTADLSSDEADGMDESLSWYNHQGTELLDETFNGHLNAITPNVKIIGLYEQCRGGGFLKDCAGPNRINISASGEMEDSYGLCSIQPCMRYDAFSYFFTVALYGKYHDGTPIAANENPDTDNSGSVSMIEAYWFAKTKDVACCNHLAPTQLLEDDGNGVGTNILPMPGSSRPGPGNEGFFASSATLE